MVATAMLLLVALTAAGAAVALVVASPKTPVRSDEQRVEPATQTVDPPSGNTAPSDPGDSSELTRAEVRDGAQDLLDRHHAYLKKAQMSPQSEYARKAWGLLSADKRAKESADGANAGQSGFEYWITKNQSENLRIGRDVTVPSADLTVEEWDPSTGVAFVCVNFGAYGGRTWVMYEDGKWSYDAGYGHKRAERTERTGLFAIGNAVTC